MLIAKLWSFIDRYLNYTLFFIIIKYTSRAEKLLFKDNRYQHFEHNLKLLLNLLDAYIKKAYEKPHILSSSIKITQKDPRSLAM